jgi:RNA polymerase sigma-70 factor, ECF subfamily
MTIGAAETHRADANFDERVEPHLRELHVHCYRMLGSLHEAEDAVQETLLKAWRALDSYAGRAPFRAWLYGIATNVCLDALRRRPRRVLPSALVPPADPTTDPAPPQTDIAWLEPYPGDCVTEPQAAIERRESIRLAFVAAVQHLPPRQRAALLLRDVLGWSAQEVADLLGTSVASANSALQRARNALDVPPLERPPDDVEAAVVERYVAAWNAADVSALAQLLREDVEMAMPPTPSWYVGREAVRTFFAATFVCFPSIRVVPTRANASPAFRVYVGEDPLAIKVVELDERGIRSITGFTDPALFARF